MGLGADLAAAWLGAGVVAGEGVDAGGGAGGGARPCSCCRDRGLSGLAARLRKTPGFASFPSRERHLVVRRKAGSSKPKQPKQQQGLAAADATATPPPPPQQVARADTAPLGRCHCTVPAE